MKNENKIYEDYTKTLIKTFFKYSFKDTQSQKITINQIYYYQMII